MYSKDGCYFEGSFDYDGTPIDAKGSFCLYHYRCTGEWKDSIGYGKVITGNGKLLYEGTWKTYG